MAGVGNSQQAQTSTAPIYAVNAKYVQGAGPGYWPTINAGLILNLASGTAFCNGSIANYSGGTLTMSASTTNYVYLNTASNCVPAVKTTIFTSSDVPIAIVITGGSSISTITDTRTEFTYGGSGLNYLLSSNNLSDLTNATTARANLSAAKSGINSDITSLTSLTTPLPITEGGTGSNTASTALTNLGGLTSASPTYTGTLSGPSVNIGGTLTGNAVTIGPHAIPAASWTLDVYSPATALASIGGLSSASPTFTGTFTGPIGNFTTSVAVGSGTPLSGAVINATQSNVGTTTQINVQNTSSDASASSDFVATADNGTNTTNFIDCGINSSAYSVSGFNTGGADDGYCYTTGNLNLAAAGAGKSVTINAGGTTTTQTIATFSPTAVTLTEPLTIPAGGMNTAAGTALSVTSGTTGAATFDSGTGGPVGVGTGANAKTVTIGNSTGASSLILNAGTSGVSGTAISVDGALTANSNTIIPSQKAVVTYVGNKVNGLAWRPAVQHLDSTVTAPGTTIVGSSAYTSDGFALINNDRILFTNASAGTYLNKVYSVAGVGTSITLTLTTDGQAGTGVPANGDAAYVTEGTANGGKIFVYNSTSGTWVQASSASGSLLATNNLSDVSNATTSRTNLVAAKSGVNSDITSLTGLTTPLSTSQGGTGAGVLTGYRYANGGGADTASTTIPYSSLVGAASSGTNSNITSLTGLTTSLPQTEGGTGSSTAATVGQMPVASSAGVYTPRTISGDVSMTSGGVATVVNLNGVTAPVSAPTAARQILMSSSTSAQQYGILTASDLPAATTSTLGAVSLTGDLGGTATVPIVDGLQGYGFTNSPTLANQVPVVTDITNKYLTWQTQSGGGSSATASYLHAAASSGQSVSATGVVIALGTTDMSSGTLVTQSGNTLFLKAGYTYHLRASIGYANFSGNNGFVTFLWRTGATGGSGTTLGNVGQTDSDMATSNSAPNTPYAEAYYTPTADTYVHLETGSVGLLTSIGSNPYVNVWAETVSSSLAVSSVSQVANYLRAYSSVSQGEPSAGGYIVLNTLQTSAGSDISINTSTGVVTLAAGHTYSIQASPGYVNFGSTSGSSSYFDIYNITSAASVPSSGCLYLNSAGAINLTPSNGPCSGIVQAAIATNVAFRYVAGVNPGTLIPTNGSTQYIYVEELPANNVYVAQTTISGNALGTSITGTDAGTGSGLAYTVAMNGASTITALSTGTIIKFVPLTASTTITPTIAVSGLAAKTVTVCGQQAAAVGDLGLLKIQTFTYDGTYWELQNPAVTVCNAMVWQAYSPSIVATGTTPSRAATRTTTALYAVLGKTLYLNFTYYAASTAGAASGSGAYLISLPGSYTVNTTLAPLPTTVSGAQYAGIDGTNVGSAQLSAGTFDAISASVEPLTSTQVGIFVGGYSNTSSAYITHNASLWSDTIFGFTIGNNERISFTAAIPIN